MFRLITSLVMFQHVRPKERQERREETQDETQDETQADTSGATPTLVNDNSGAEAGKSIVHANEFNSDATGEKLAPGPDRTTWSDDRVTSPAMGLYNILFDHGKARYDVKSLKRKVPAWQALEAVPTCTLQDEQFHRGDYVRIQLDGGQDPDDGCLARIRAIRALPQPDIRRLLRIAWLYRINGRLYNSHHQQILLWDTIDGPMAHDDIGTIQEDKLYDACLTSKGCGKRQSRKWEELEKQTFDPCQDMSVQV